MHFRVREAEEGRRSEIGEISEGVVRSGIESRPLDEAGLGKVDGDR